MTAIPIPGSSSETRSTRAVTALPRRLPSWSWRPQRMEVGRAPLPVAAAMFGIVFALRMLIDNATASGLNLLYTVPILLVTTAYGTAAGAAAATAAASLMFLWADLQAVDLGPVGFATRVLVLYVVPLAVAIGARANAPAASATPDAGPSVSASPAGGRQDPPKSLTRRELEVLSLLAAGHTNAEIAEKLVLSVRTVESHRASMQRKLGRPSRPELVRYALRRGLIPGA